MKILDLVLKTKWYDMTVSGEKREEYRDDSPYWCRRFTGKDYVPFSQRYGYEPLNANVNGYTHVRIRRAYTKTAALFRLKEITYGFGNSSWGAPDTEVFILKYGERVE